MINEDQVEQLAIEWFKELGYDYLHGYDIAPDSSTPERKNYQEVLLSKRLHTSLTKLNPSLPKTAIDEAVHLLQKPQHATLIQNNRAFHKMLLQGIPVEVKGKDGSKGDVLALTKAFSLCGTLDEAKEHKEEIAFFQAVKTIIQKSDRRPEAKNDPNKAIKQIIDNAVVSEGVEDIFTLVGLDKPNIGILSEEFLEDVAHMEHKNLAVELLERLLKDEIKAKTRTNIVQEKKFSDRLQATLTQYHNRAIETAKVIEELIQMAKDFAEANRHGEELGLSFDELAFYDALAENESAMREMGDEILKNIAIELTKKLRNSVSVDWQKRESVRAKMRNMIRIILRRYKYPPDQQLEAIKMVMKQAEVLSDEWSHNEYDAPVKDYAVNNGEGKLLMVADDTKREYGKKDDKLQDNG